jgi:hypothetical protein
MHHRVQRVVVAICGEKTVKNIFIRKNSKHPDVQLIFGTLGLLLLVGWRRWVGV